MCAALDTRLGLTGRIDPMRILVRTLGCKVNQVESDSLVGLLGALSPRVVDLDQAADLVLINTCAVTSTAGATTRKEIRRARRANPAAYVVVTGCYAELEPEEVRILGADLVVPNNRKAELPGAVLDHFGLPNDPVTTPPNEFWGAGERGLSGDRVRAFIKIQDGCNAGCAYCIIPRLRGRERHRKGREALLEARALLEAGIEEIVLTGVRLGSYAGHPGGIAGLVKDLAEMGARVRLSSIEPEDTTEALLEVMAHYTRVRPHLHLSLQTGSERLLSMVGRRYDKGYYRTLVREAYRQIPGFALSTDVIAGLPTETENEHRETLSFLRELQPVRVHAFTYTPRPKTRAAGMPQLPMHTRRRRTKELIALGYELAEARVSPLLGGRVEVLVEQHKDGQAWGHTPDYFEVHAEDAVGTRPGDTVWVRIREHRAYLLLGAVEGLKVRAGSLLISATG